MKFTSIFSQRVQEIFELCLKYRYKRARNMKFTSFFSQRVQKIFEFTQIYIFFYNIHLGLQVLRLSLESASFEFER